MMQDAMIREMQELKLAGCTVDEAYDELKSRHTKAPTKKTVRKHHNMDGAPEDNHAKVRKQMAFDCEPFRSEVIEIAERNPDAYMSSIYDVLVEKFVEGGDYEALPGNEQTLRNFIRRLKEDGEIAPPEERRRKHDVIDTPPPGEKAQVDFGQWRCGGGLVAHFIVVVLWFSRPIWVTAQDHEFNAEEACRALHRFSCKCGGRVRTLVIGQDGVFVGEEACGEVFEAEAFEAFLSEQDMALRVCNKADPASKGLVENAAGFVKSPYFSARSFSRIDDVTRTLPAWAERKNRRIHQGAYQVPQRMFEDFEKAALRPLLPSVHEAAPTGLVEAPASSQPYVLHKAVKHPVPWEMRHSAAYKRVVGDKLHVHDSKRRHVCTHDVCDVKGAFIRLDEHRRQPAGDWLGTAERMRRKWNCTEFQRFVNGFKRENEGRHLGKQLAAVGRYLDERAPSRSFVADVMAVCCRGFRHRHAQFKAVFGLMESQQASPGGAMVAVPAADVGTRALDRYQSAFEERCA